MTHHRLLQLLTGLLIIAIGIIAIGASVTFLFVDSNLASRPLALIPAIAGLILIPMGYFVTKGNTIGEVVHEFLDIVKAQFK